LFPAAAENDHPLKPELMWTGREVHICALLMCLGGFQDVLLGSTTQLNYSTIEISVFQYPTA